MKKSKLLKVLIMPETIDAVKIIIAFIMPGFVTDYIVSFAAPRQKREPLETMLTAITFSSINYAMFVWLVLIITRPGFYSAHELTAISCWLFLLLVAPVLEGFLFVRLANSETGQKLFQFLKPKNVRFIPTAWDFIFSQELPVWVLITLVDDTMIGGYYGGDSYATSFPHEQELYIETVWRLSENGGFVSPVENSSGCLMRMKDIKYIEFFA